MSLGSAPDPHAEFPFSANCRASDRARLLVQAIASVWDSILQLPLLAREDHGGEDVKVADLPLICGHIRISGAWEGTVAMTAPRALAATCAGIMYGQPAADVSEVDIRDAWGELTNMVGGIVKALVTPICGLGLPTIHDRAMFGYEEEGLRVINDVTFACLGQRLRLTVLQPQR